MSAGSTLNSPGRWRLDLPEIGDEKKRVDLSSRYGGAGGKLGGQQKPAREGLTSKLRIFPISRS